MERHTKHKHYYAQGTTILEVLIYVAVFAIVAVIISNFLIQVVNAYNISRAERDVLSNGRLILETVTKNIAEAEEIYTPTSTFNTDIGQLSLKTKTGTQSGHDTGYVDFWVDNGQMWMKKEGSQARTISATSVRISTFRLERLSQGLARDAVRMTLEVDFTQSRFSTSIILTSTTALRGSY